MVWAYLQLFGIPVPAWSSGSGEAEALERLARAAGPAPPTSPHPALL